MAATMRGVEAIKSERAARQQSGRHGTRASIRHQQSNIRAGGALAIPIAPLELAVKFAAEWRARFLQALPRDAIAERQATALAYNLLWQWDRPALTHALPTSALDGDTII
jgi:hypothetical protein